MRDFIQNSLIANPTEKEIRLISFSSDDISIGIAFNDGKIRFYPTSIEGFYKVAKVMLGEDK